MAWSAKQSQEAGECLEGRVKHAEFPGVGGEFCMYSPYSLSQGFRSSKCLENVTLWTITHPM